MDTILDFDIVEDKMQGIIKVIGVGGGGCNAVRNMYNEGSTRIWYERLKIITLPRELVVWE
jgi:cell division protein FtsZ